MTLEQAQLMQQQAAPNEDQELLLKTKEKIDKSKQQGTDEVSNSAPSEQSQPQKEQEEKKDEIKESEKTPIKEEKTEEEIQEDDKIKKLKVRQKRLVKEQLIEHFKEQISFFQDATDEEGFSSPEALARSCQLSWLYFDYRSKRKAFGQIMIEMGFTDTCLRMLNYFNRVGVFRNDATWKPCYYTYNCLWNYSDASRSLAKELGEKGFVKLLAANISHQPYLVNLTSKNVYYLVKASLSIMQNISRAPEVVSFFDEANVKQLLDPFLKSEDDFLRAIATMVLSSIINEKENAMLEDSGGMPYIILCLQKAVGNTKTRRHRGFCPAELTECLGRMAVNDKNKTTIVEAGALPLFVDLLQHKDEEEHLAAGKALWTLAFDADVRQKIIEQPGCMEALEALTASENSDVRHTVKGALWVIKGDQRKGEPAPTEGQDISQKKKRHLFISYSWDNQEAVIEIKDKLKSEGYHVWIDVEQMGGSTLEAMAEAVENACVVIICVSEKYKLSPNARTEAEYTFQLKKPIIPLMMQRRYKPDGWLGMLMGSKFYINFDGKYEFDDAYEMLVRELNGRGLGEEVEEAVDVVDSGGGLAATPAAAPAPPRLPAVASWSKEKVGEWLEEQDLQHLKSHFEEYNGRLLNRFSKLRKEAPEFFYSCLKDQLHLSMLDILRLTEAMGTLPK